MQGNFVETLIGLAVVAVAAAFFYFAATTTGSGTPAGGYELVAKFDRVDGVSTGSDVKLSGIKVGVVSKQELDQTTYRAIVRMTIQGGVKVPEDSSIKITNEGLLGGSYLSIAPGGSDVMLQPGQEFSTTQGAVDLIGLLSRAFLSGSSSSETPPPAAAAPAEPGPPQAAPVP
jgi:phospholipid/cholesterol/gamma-HCH transport system substrate-binding protein